MAGAREYLHFHEIALERANERLTNHTFYRHLATKAPQGKQIFHHSRCCILLVKGTRLRCGRRLRPAGLLNRREAVTPCRPV